VDEITRQRIGEVVADLIEAGDFEASFSRVP
jgi:hypothetical protein